LFQVEKVASRKPTAANAGAPGAVASVAPISYVLAAQSDDNCFYDLDRNNFAPRLAVAWTPLLG
jgi:hypothetical protein